MGGESVVDDRPDRSAAGAVLTAVGATRGFAPTRLGQVHYRLSGSGRPLVLLHRTPDSSLLFGDVTPCLADHNQVIAFDTPGFGDSEALAGPPGMAGFSGAIIDALDELHVSRFHLLGHRTGAAIAVEIAALHPERVDRLVLSGLAAFTPDERAAGPEQRPVRRLLPDGSHFTTTWQRSQQSMGGWITTEQLQRIVTDVFRNSPNAVRYAELAVYEQDLEVRLRSIAAPTLLLYGETDPFAAWLAVLAACLRTGEGAIVPGAHQLIMLEDPAGYCRRVVAFLHDREIQS